MRPDVCPALLARSRVGILSLGTLSAGTLAALLLAGPLAGSAQAVATVVPLGTASAFSVLAGSTVTNTGTTSVDRNVGVSPGTAITGGSTLVVGGTTHSADAVAAQAQVDLTTAYGNAAGQTPRVPQDDELAGETLAGGVYHRAGAMALDGTLTLDGQNDPDSVWVFQAGSTLTTGSGSSVVLINGANACNVFWQVGSSATLGTATSFVGTIMADQSITMDTGATLRGRALARVAAVNLNANVITSPSCGTPSGTPTATPSGTPTATPTGTPSSTPSGSPTVTPSATPSGTPTTAPTSSAAPAEGAGGSGGDADDDDDGGAGKRPTTHQITRKPTGSVDAGVAGPVRTDDHRPWV